MILELDKLEMLLMLEKMEKGLLDINDGELLNPPLNSPLNPPPNPPNPTIFPIKII